VSLRPGARLGPYEIVAALGRGGMGEVYRASDSILGRDVAIKVLPDALTHEAERLARFKREARVLASLNNPHIGAVYGLENAEGAPAIVLELIEGPTIADRLTGGALPVREALRIAEQIAEALEAAHAKGIIHRDLKPSNLKITPAGTLKVIDFGLATVCAGDTPDWDPARSPTITLSGIRDGVLLGTAPYMSPEQVRHKPVDKRTDIWAFGCVLFEMLTGRTPFPGETISDIIVAILTRGPDWRALPAETPGRVRCLLQRCLDKDHARRLRDIAEARIEIGEALTVSATGPAHARGGLTPVLESYQATPIAPKPGVSRIRTLPRRRIAFVGLVAAVSGFLAISAWWLWTSTRDRASPPVGMDVHSIAVLPFLPLGPEADDRFLGFGLADALIARLSRLRGVVVRPVTAVAGFDRPDRDTVAEARRIKVDAVLDGSVQRSGDRLRVTVKLVRVADGASLWSAQYDERTTDLFAIEDSIGARVVEGLAFRLSRSERERLSRRDTANPDAHLAYLRGRYLWNRRTPADLQRAVELLETAVRLDPSYALAHSGLADAYLILGGYSVISQRQAIPQARLSAQRALALDDTLAEVHTSLALIAMNYDWDWSEADRQYRMAIDLNPNYSIAHAWYGEYLAFMGRFAEGIAQNARAQELDPLSLIISTDGGKIFVLARQYDRAIAQLEKTLEMDPQFMMAHIFLARALLGVGRVADAVSVIDNASPDDQAVLAIRGVVYKAAGRPDRTRAILDHLRMQSRHTYVSPTNLAFLEAALGLADDAFSSLNRMCDERAVGPIGLKTEELYDPIRKDPRFPALLRRVGLTP
jgi:TolB-like protein/Tfp pilus assembly protein PilF